MEHSRISARRSRGRPRLGRFARPLAAGLVLALTLVACGSGDDPGGTPDVEDTGAADDAATDGGASGDTQLVVSAPQEPATWDWVDSAATALRVVIMLNVVQPLLEEQEDSSVEPLLAESFEISDDGLEYLFHLREAVFHDGSELTADDVIYSLEFNRSSEQGALKSVFEPVETIEKVDDLTVRITLNRPSQQFLVGMAKDSGLIIPEGSSDQIAREPIGTGPYTFDDWRPGTNVQLSRFDDYWGEQPFFTDVEFRFISDETAAINALLAGDTDAITQIAGEGIERVNSVEETEGFARTSHSTMEFTYLSLNAEREKFDDERIRHAIAHAIDRQPIFDAAFAGFGEPNCVFASPLGVPWDSDYCPYPYDPERARELLADAGAEGMEIDFKFLTVAEFPPIMEVVTSQLTDVGFTVNTVGRELTTYLDEVLAEPFDYEFTSLSGPQPIDAWAGGGWFTQYADEEFDRLLREADQTVDRDEWADMRREAIERYADAAYLIPIGNKEGISLHRDDLVGVAPYRGTSEFDLRPLGWG